MNLTWLNNVRHKQTLEIYLIFINNKCEDKSQNNLVDLALFLIV